jgi:hypothetical protein
MVWEPLERPSKPRPSRPPAISSCLNWAAMPLPWFESLIYTASDFWGASNSTYFTTGHDQESQVVNLPIQQKKIKIFSTFFPPLSETEFWGAFQQAAEIVSGKIVTGKKRKVLLCFQTAPHRPAARTTVCLCTSATRRVCEKPLKM